MWRRDGKRRELGLGGLAGTAPVGLALAREKADRVRAIIARGGDPFLELPDRQARAHKTTFAEAVTAYLSTLTFKNDKHAAQWPMTLGPTYCPDIQSLAIDAVETSHIADILEPIWQTKAETASRLRGRLERVLDYARVQGWRVGENPARWKGHLEHVLGKQGVTVKHHAAMPAGELPAFAAELWAKASTGAKALLFTILTAARSGEVRGATWPEIDLEAAVWTVPAGRMKMKREHRVPLSPCALEVLAWAKERATGDLVFAGKGGKPLSDMTLAKVLKDAGLSCTVHGFRSTFRDWCGDATAYPRELAEQALAHQVGDATEQAYRRSDALEKRRQLMASWESYLLGIT